MEAVALQSTAEPEPPRTAILTPPAASDHPTTIAFPEGEYLKGLAVLRR